MSDFVIVSYYNQVMVHELYIQFYVYVERNYFYTPGCYFLIIQFCVVVKFNLICDQEKYTFLDH